MTRKEMDSVKVLHDVLDRAIALAYECSSKDEESGKWSRKGDAVRSLRTMLMGLKEQVSDMMWTPESMIGECEFFVDYPWNRFRAESDLLQADTAKQYVRSRKY